MKFRILIASLMFFISLPVFCQEKQFLYFFDKDFNPADRAKSFFRGVGVYRDSTLELKLYNSITSKLIALEHYADSALRLEDGLFLTYFSNSSLSSKGSFVKGKEEGLWMRWDTAGHTIDSAIYSNGEKLIEVHTGYYENGSLDSLIVNDIKADRLEKMYYNKKGNLTSETSFIGQKGIVKSYDSTMHLRIDTVFSRIEIEASFPGGEQAWTQYITKQIAKNVDALIADGKSGICRLRFIVDKEGNIKNAEAITMQGTRLAKVAVNAIMKGPKWIPANQYGRYVNAFREQPVTFTISN